METPLTKRTVNLARRVVRMGMTETDTKEMMAMDIQIMAMEI